MDNYWYPKTRDRILNIRRTQYVPSTIVNFNYTGGDQTWTVPTGINSLIVTLRGSGGGNGTDAGGNTTALGGAGGLVSGTLAVSPGDILTLIVGGYQDSGSGGVYFTTGRSYGGGGYASTGNYTNRNGGIGGGRTAIRRGATELVTAGGGGGAGATGAVGGAGGGLIGGDGRNGNLYSDPWGLGGTQTAGGTRSDGDTNAQGSQFSGGNCYGINGPWSGGGGSGYYGGGGSASGGSGGGGSSYIANLSGTVVNTRGGGSVANTAGSLSILY